VAILFNFFAPLPLAFFSILMGENRQWGDPLTRTILGLSFAAFVIGLLWALWRRERGVALFLVPLLITHIATFLVGDIFRSLLAGPKALLGLIALVYLVVEVVAVLWAMSRVGSSRMPALLIGWFCVLYAALPVLYFAQGIGGL